MPDGRAALRRSAAMMCEACERGDHFDCGMQTWCECECPGPHGIYDGPHRDFFSQPPDEDEEPR